MAEARHAYIKPKSAQWAQQDRQSPKRSNEHDTTRTARAPRLRDVRYLLEGSVQRSSNRLRVNVQLIDSGTGNHLWAERFDKPMADLFEMQDEIVSRTRQCIKCPAHRG